MQLVAAAPLPLCNRAPLTLPLPPLPLLRRRLLQRPGLRARGRQLPLPAQLPPRVWQVSGARGGGGQHAALTGALHCSAAGAGRQKKAGWTCHTQHVDLFDSFRTFACRSGVVHANECVAKCLDRVAFPCDGLPEAKCQRRCMAASLRRYG